MTEQLEKEIQKIIDNHNLHCTITEFKNYVNWYSISRSEKFSEELLREFKDDVNWNYISHHQKLSEALIREFKNKVKWYYISSSQKLSEEFIKEFKDYVNWDCISSDQRLSEVFIREFQDYVDWQNISKYQKLSEEFIREFNNYIDWDFISRYQKLSEEFITEFNIKIPENNWLYTSKEDKLKYIKENTNYELIDDEYIVAYKSVRSDRYSVYNFQYQYLNGKTYESHCDCNNKKNSSFGLSAWTLEGAQDYYAEGKILKINIAIDKIGAIVHNNQKIRCFEFTVIKEI